MGGDFHQQGQQVQGPQTNIGGDVGQLTVNRTQTVYERARLPEVDRVQLAQAQALLVSMPIDTLPEPGSLPLGSRPLLARNPIFVGRGEELRRLAAALKGGETVALGQVVASTGMGGLGKTQLAVELVHRCGRFFAGGVFWISFASPQEIPLQIAACASPGAMGLVAGSEGLSFEDRLQLVMGAWQSEIPRLLIFDNCEEEALLEAWRPPGGGCRVLVTSRRAQWAPTLGVTVLALDLLPRPDSVELLRGYRPDRPPGDQGLDAIANELGDLPLALHLAGSYLRAYRSRVSLSDYLDELLRPEVIEHASMLGRGLDRTPSPTGHVQCLAQTFALGLARLDRDQEVDRVAIALLARLACLAPGEPVPTFLLDLTVQGVDPLLHTDGQRRLGDLGLVQAGEGWLRLHRLLVHFVRREDLDPQAQAAVDDALIACRQAASNGYLMGPALVAVVPHLVDVAASAGEESDDLGRGARLCDATGSALQHAGDLGAARPWYERALGVRERVLGPDHPDTAASLNNLAILLRAQGELAAARPLFERALEINERVLGPDHPATALCLNNLARLLQDQGELAAARPLFERALQLRERMLGPDHPDTAQSLNNLACLLQDQGVLVPALSLYERALKIRERVLGPHHPATATSLNDLANLLQDQGEPVAARLLMERALTIRERVLGPDHPDTAQSLNNLAILLRAQGELAPAGPLFERALAICERLLGPDHPTTATIRRNMSPLVI
jgi:tetratricopeptide (TPR) repeat protein